MSKDSLKRLTERHTSTEEIQCFLCLHTPNDVRKCNHCSGIVCAKCIENWLNRNEMCPKCSHAVQATDFVATADDSNCSIHPKETSKIFCRTCQISICSQCVLIKNEHINHDYDNPNEDYHQILRLNKKLLEFLRKCHAESQENLKMIELSMEILFNEHNENLEKSLRDDSRINETQRLLDEYQQKRQEINRTMKDDEMLIKDIERRLLRSTCLSDQEEILQILQRHIPSIK